MPDSPVEFNVPLIVVAPALASWESDWTRMVGYVIPLAL